MTVPPNNAGMDSPSTRDDRIPRSGGFTTRIRMSRGGLRSAASCALREPPCSRMPARTADCTSSPIGLGLHGTVISTSR